MGSLPRIMVTKPGNSGKFIHYLPFLIHSPQASIKLLLCTGYCSKGFEGILGVQDLDSPLKELTEQWERLTETMR